MKRIYLQISQETWRQLEEAAKIKNQNQLARAMENLEEWTGGVAWTPKDILVVGGMQMAERVIEDGLIEEDNQDV